MAKEKYTYGKVEELATLRKPLLSQQAAAKYFELKNRNTIRAWEQGLSRPHVRLRAKFIWYLWDKLNLRSDPEQFSRIWHEIMEKQWGWDPLTDKENPRRTTNLQSNRTEEKTLSVKPHLLPRVAMNERLSMGRVVTDMIVLAYGTYGTKQIECFYNDQEIPLPKDLLRLKEDFINDYKERAASGKMHMPYNSPTYKLRGFDVGKRTFINGEEIPILSLSFGPTDYFTHYVTDLNVQNPVRDKYMRRAKDISVQPVPEFATTLGINLNLITKDGYLIITRRSSRTMTEPDKYHTSVGEGLLRPTDAGPTGAPDPFKCAIRGTFEELGISLTPEAVEFNAFCVHVERGQYSLFGWSRLKETRKEVELVRLFGVPKDKWENRALNFIICDLHYIAQFLSEKWEYWSDTGLAALLFSLLQMGYSPQEIEKVFSHV